MNTSIDFRGPFAVKYWIVILIECQITCSYWKIALLLKYDDNANINKATFYEDIKIPSKHFNVVSTLSFG